MDTFSCLMKNSDRYSPDIMTILAHLETIQWRWYWWRWPFPWKPPRFWSTHNLHHVSHQNLPQGSGPPGDNPLLSPLLAPPPLALTGSCSVRGRPALAVQRALLYWLVFLQIFLAIIFSITLLVREGVKKKTGKKRSGWPLGLTPPPPPKRSGKCEKKLISAFDFGLWLSMI